jgi:uncharacterized protein (UPF0332 family)
LPHNTIQWCLKQKKGIRLIEPNENLAKAYIKKAKGSLHTMDAALHINETDWVITTAYYARYFALYALLMKLGIKSEIHDCSIAIAQLLAKHGILHQNLSSDLSKAKQTRIESQYYITRQLDQSKIRKNVKSAHKFLIEIEKTLENITKTQIENIRTHLKRIPSSKK